MAGPSGAILQSTRRGSRYWALRGHVQSAIAAAAGRSANPKPTGVEAPEALGIMEACPQLHCDLACTQRLLSHPPEHTLQCSIIVEHGYDPSIKRPLHA